LYRFEVIADSRLNFGHYVLEPPLEGLGSMYTIHLRLTGKRIVDFLIVIIELFLPSVMAEALQTKTDKNRSLARGWVIICHFHI